METRVSVPSYDADAAAAALSAHVGERMRLADCVTGVPQIPYVNPLVKDSGRAGRLSGTDFVLRAVEAVSGGVDLMVEDCGTGKRWRMCITVPLMQDEPDFYVVSPEPDDRRDRNLREVFG